MIYVRVYLAALQRHLYNPCQWSVGVTALSYKRLKPVAKSDMKVPELMIAQFLTCNNTEAWHKQISLHTVAAFAAEECSLCQKRFQQSLTLICLDPSAWT